MTHSKRYWMWIAAFALVGTTGGVAATSDDLTRPSGTAAASLQRVAAELSDDGYRIFNIQTTEDYGAARGEDYDPDGPAIQTTLELTWAKPFEHQSKPTQAVVLSLHFGRTERLAAITQGTTSVSGYWKYYRVESALRDGLVRGQVESLDAACTTYSVTVALPNGERLYVSADDSDYYFVDRTHGQAAPAAAAAIVARLATKAELVEIRVAGSGIMSAHAVELVWHVPGGPNGLRVTQLGLDPATGNVTSVVELSGPSQPYYQRLAARPKRLLQRLAASGELVKLRNRSPVPDEYEPELTFTRGTLALRDELYRAGEFECGC